MNIIQSLFIVLLWLLPLQAEEHHRPSTVSDRKVDSQQLTNDIRNWALGCGAVLFESNHDRHDLLAGEVESERNIQRFKRLLHDSWGIDNRDDLLSAIRSLDRGGHRKGFSYWYNIVKYNTEEQLAPVLRFYKHNHELIYEIGIIRKHLNEVNNRGILAWDYCRIIHLCRWGYLCGYMKEQEAWDCILYYARILQKNFASWEEMGKNYLIGREYWSESHSKKNGYRWEDAFQRLIDMPSSPWNKYPWDMELGTGKPPTWLKPRIPKRRVAPEKPKIQQPKRTKKQNYF